MSAAPKPHSAQDCAAMSWRTRPTPGQRAAGRQRRGRTSPGPPRSGGLDIPGEWEARSAGGSGSPAAGRGFASMMRLATGNPEETRVMRRIRYRMARSVRRRWQIRGTNATRRLGHDEGLAQMQRLPRGTRMARDAAWPARSRRRRCDCALPAFFTLAALARRHPTDPPDYWQDTGSRGRRDQAANERREQHRRANRRHDPFRISSVHRLH
jgi:hypothetical protein